MKANVSASKAEKVVKHVHIRWMIRRDIHEVLRIENISHPNPWTKEDFLETLRGRTTIGIVAEHPSGIVGYAVYELMKDRMMLINIAVDPHYRHEKIGTTLIMKMISKLSPYLRPKIVVELRESNLAAQLFFKANGFIATKVYRERYEDTGEDAYRMEYNINDSRTNKDGR